jgi:glutaminyl-tRNA synthetase
VKNAAGEIVELRCRWDPESRGGNATDGRKIKGTIHWVSAAQSVEAEVRLYDRLFSVENPLSDKDVDWKSHINPGSLEIVRGARVEPSLATRGPLERFQFERLGYFCVDVESKPGKLVVNRTISLKDSWAAQASAQK